MLIGIGSGAWHNAAIPYEQLTTHHTYHTSSDDSESLALLCLRCAAPILGEAEGDGEGDGEDDGEGDGPSASAMQ